MVESGISIFDIFTVFTLNIRTEKPGQTVLNLEQTPQNAAFDQDLHFCHSSLFKF